MEKTMGVEGIGPSEEELGIKPAETGNIESKPVLKNFSEPVEVSSLVRLRHPLPAQSNTESRSAEFETPFSESILEMKWNNRDTYDRITDAAKPFFADQVVIDLGAGASHNGYAIAQDCGAKAYIGVEPFFSSALKRSMRDSEIEEDMFVGRKEIPYAISGTDMLSFLSSLEDNSVSIMLCGIDTIIIDSDEMRQKIFQEIKRVVSEHGGLFSIESFIGPDSSVDSANVAGSIDLASEAQGQISAHEELYLPKKNIWMLSKESLHDERINCNA